MTTDDPNCCTDADDVFVWARLVRVSQAVLTRVEADLRKEGLPPLAWYDALLELKRAGDEGLRPFELQREMLLAQYNMSRLVDKLEEAGYLERCTCLEDGRGQQLRIAEAGKTFLSKVWPIYHMAIKSRFLDRLEPGEIEDLGRILGKLRD